jgi:hypothetical protein|tara:strand:- start:497 stop:793 length:297 start_codon:yes stop_codon:yes gene_type:complete
MEKNYKELGMMSKYRTEVSILGLVLMFFLGYTTHDLVNKITHKEPRFYVQERNQKNMDKMLEMRKKRYQMREDQARKEGARNKIPQRKRQKVEREKNI